MNLCQLPENNENYSQKYNVIKYWVSNTTVFTEKISRTLTWFKIRIKVPITENIFSEKKYFGF